MKTRQGRPMRILAIALLSCLTSFALADDGLAQRFAQVMTDLENRQHAYAAGQERAVFCTYCHGETGNSKRPHIPNLAGQNPLYLFKDRKSTRLNSSHVKSRMPSSA